MRIRRADAHAVPTTLHGFPPPHPPLASPDHLALTRYAGTAARLPTLPAQSMLAASDVLNEAVYEDIKRP